MAHPLFCFTFVNTRYHVTTKHTFSIPLVKNTCKLKTPSHHRGATSSFVSMTKAVIIRKCFRQSRRSLIIPCDEGKVVAAKERFNSPRVPRKLIIPHGYRRMLCWQHMPSFLMLTASEYGIRCAYCVKLCNVCGTMRMCFESAQRGTWHKTSAFEIATKVVSFKTETHYTSLDISK